MDSPGEILGGRGEAADSRMIATAESKLDSAYDTVAPISPCFRRGAVLQAVDAAEDDREPISRNAFQARELGLALVDQAPAIDKAVAETIRISAKELGIRTGAIKLRRAPVRSRFAPGLILDFPQHEFRLGSLPVRERTCVTVCYNQAASKIWIRFVVGEGDAKISPSQLADFFQFSDAASRAGIDRVRAIYFDLFRKQIGRKAVEFDELGEIDFVGLDTDCLQFGDYLYIDEVGIVADSDEISPERREVFVSFFQQHLSALFPEKFRENEIRKISEDRVSAFRSEFAYRALYHGIFRERAVTFLVMSEPGGNVPDDFYGGASGALTVISELAARALKEF